jgi:ABC-type phosphate/phosphonate transport system substrate-binding protein
MKGRRILGAGLGALAALWLTLTSHVTAGDKAADAQGVRIGLVTTLFRDVSPALSQVAMQPFAALMRSQTGVEGQPVVSGDALTLGRDLHDGKVQLGVFHGVEFSWAQEKYPDLRPLVIVINRQRNLRANLVVRNDSAVKTFADLKGKALALPRRSREHSHLFLEKACRELGATPKTQFGEIVNQATIEDALDDVLRKKVDGAVVDSVALECYELLKPGCYAGLKVVQHSCVFPAAVVAYRAGGVDDTTLGRIRDGLIRANQDARGKELMFMWNLTAFENIPDDFQQILTEVRKSYPAPTAAAPAQH